MPTDSHGDPDKENRVAADNPVELGEITCWCGATGTYDELFDDDFLEPSCGGMGILHCRCGGDLCVCHNHGEIECHGCPDCEEHDDDWEDDYEDD